MTQPPSYKPTLGTSDISDSPNIARYLTATHLLRGRHQKARILVRVLNYLLCHDKWNGYRTSRKGLMRIALGRRASTIGTSDITESGVSVGAWPHKFDKCVIHLKRRDLGQIASVVDKKPVAEFDRCESHAEQSCGIGTQRA